MLDPTNPESFTWKTADISGGYHYRYIDQCPQSSTSSRVILCLHGFPDLALGWRYQIIDLVKRGYRVIAPDLLGYGGTSKPVDVEAYSKLNSSKALLEILDQENITQKVIVAGHDWGAALAARFVQYFPQRVKCWVTICVPPSPASQPGQPPVDIITLIRKRMQHLGYQIYLMSPEASEDASRNCKTFLLLAYHHWGRGLESAIESKLSRYNSGKCVLEGEIQKQLKELDNQLESVEVMDPETRHFLSEFENGGMTGPLNWCRTHAIDQADEQAAALPLTFPSDIPCLFIRATNDPALPPSLFTEKMKTKLFPTNNLTWVTIEGGTHFLLQNPNYRDEVTKALGDWIDIQECKDNAQKGPPCKSSYDCLSHPVSPFPFNMLRRVE